jgi:predicted kinase
MFNDALKGSIMSKCYQLVGVPGSGKSTWIKNQTWALGLSIVSTDNFVEAYAHMQNKTYNEVFEEYMPIAVRLMANQALVCQANGVDVIWDQTSTTLASRTRKFNMLPDYEHIAVVFKTPDPEELTRRLASRPGKNIPDHVIRSMIDGFEMPTLEEGFTEIWKI